MSEDRGADHVANKNAKAIRSLGERRTWRKVTRSRREPNRRLQVAAKLILDYGAREVTEALRSINEDLESIGYPSGGSSSRAPSTMDPAGEDALRASNLFDQRECFRDLITAHVESAEEIVRFAAALNRKPVITAADVALCAEGQMVRDGSHEWGTKDCTEIPVTRGLCGKCYQAESKWRRATGLVGREKPAA